MAHMKDGQEVSHKKFVLLGTVAQRVRVLTCLRAPKASVALGARA